MMVVKLILAVTAFSKTTTINSLNQFSKAVTTTMTFDGFLTSSSRVLLFGSIRQSLALLRQYMTSPRN